MRNRWPTEVTTGTHGWFDRFGISLNRSIHPAIFSEGTDSPPFDAHLASIEINQVPLDQQAFHEIILDTLEGNRSIGYLLRGELQADRPTIIYHHGIGEVPFHSSFYRLLQPNQLAFDANLIAVRAPFHRTVHGVGRGTASVSNVLSMLAASVELIEALQTAIRSSIDQPVIVAGISLGGVVSSLHHIQYGSADRYVPILAGLALDDVFFNSALQPLVAELTDVQRRSVQHRLNFVDAFAETNPAGVHPILARDDRIVRYPVQADSFNGRPIVTIDGSHLSASISSRLLREHLSNVVTLTQYT